MAIQRRLPRTDEERNTAFSAAKTKKDNSSPGADIPLTPNTIARLDIAQPDLAAKMLARGTALQAQSRATAAKDAAQSKARMYISHFIQTFNDAVEREVFQPSDRAYYQLDVNSNSVPPLTSEADITTWGKRLIDGDAARVAAGGAPMSMPSIAEVTAVYNDFLTKNADQSTRKDDYDNAQEAISDMHEETDKLILRIWDEVETAFNDEPISSKRRKAREWGVVYISTTNITISGICTNAATGEPHAGFLVQLIGTEDQAISTTDGSYSINTKATGEQIMECSHPDFVTQRVSIVIEAEGIVQDFALQPA